MSRLLTRHGPLIALLALVAFLPLFFPTGYYYRVAALVWTAALAAAGLNLMMGYAGQVSLGHAGFLGMGAYAMAILPTHFGIHGLVAFPIGVAAAGLLAYVIGRPILRLRGHNLAVATLGLGILVSLILQSEGAWTGGPDGMDVARIEVFGWRVRGAVTWYWITGAFLILGTWLASNLVDSSTGRALRAIHDSEIAARVAGVDVARVKLLAFVVSAVYAAVAGALLAGLNGFVTPDAAGFMHSIELVTMVVLGGMGSLLGPVVGAALLVLLPQLLTAFHEYENLILGLVLMVTMIFLRAGIVPSVAARLQRRPA